MPFVAPADPAHRSIAAFACTLCTAPAGVRCLPDCPASLGIEFITLDARRPVCVEECSSANEDPSFWSVLADGTTDGFTRQWRTAGSLIGCAFCGPVFSRAAVLADREHVQVLYRLATPPVPFVI